MAVLTPFFIERPGVEQGRVETPEGLSPPPEGSHVLVLGADTPGWTQRFKVGDKIQVFQQVTIGASKIVRFRGRLRGPSRMPLITGSEPYALLDGDTLLISVDGGADQTFTFETADFFDIANATAVEVRNVIAATLTGARVYLTGDRVAIESLETGRRTGVVATGGTSGAALQPQRLHWHARMYVDGNLQVDREIKTGDTVDLRDMAANLAIGGSAPQILFQLELVSS